MTGTSKVIIMLVVWLLYALVAYFGCLQECCGDLANDGRGLTEEVPAEVITEETASPAINQYALASKWSELNLYTNDDFGDLKGSVLAQMTDDNILEITGYHYEGETAPEGFENMGLARADAIWKRHFSDIPEERIQLRARLMDGADRAQEGFFEAATFSWLEAEKTVAETVEELDDRIIIRFPFGSAEKEYSQQVDEYLDKLANRVIQTKEQISLTGHTDNVGQPEANMKLGQQRANGIKGILTSKGVDATQILTDSKGESQPVASNSTEQGRYENRRCEVRLMKNQSN